MPNGDPARDQAPEHFAQWMIPSDVLMFDRRGSVRIRSGTALADWAPVEVRILDLLEAFIKHPHDRMKFHEHETAAGLQEMPHDPRPSVEIRRPANRATRGAGD